MAAAAASKPLLPALMPARFSACSSVSPLGKLEFVDGQFPASSDIVVEVTSVASMHQAAAAWLKSEGLDVQGADAQRLSALEPTSWKSEMFAVEPVVGFRICFWAWTDPLAGKPVAVEGDV